MKGARPKSETLKLITGNPGKRPLGSPKPAPVAPSCPDWLDDVARAKWHELAPKLDKLGLLTELDGESLALLCMHWSNAVHAQQMLQQFGLVVGGKRNPAAGLLKDSTAAYIRLAGLFGLNPTDRERLRAPEVKEDGDDFFSSSIPD